eukprot:5468194-Prymnesium_polylepis.1
MPSRSYQSQSPLFIATSLLRAAPSAAASVPRSRPAGARTIRADHGQPTVPPAGGWARLAQRRQVSKLCVECSHSCIGRAPSPQRRPVARPADR